MGGLLLGLLVVLAMACQTITGFGFAVVFVPVAMFFVSAKDAVVLSVLLGASSYLFFIAEVKGKLPLRGVAVLVIASVAGAPLGGVLLRIAPPTAIRTGANVVVLGAILVTVAARKPAVRSASGPWNAAIGLVSGAISAAVGMGGPPVALYLSITTRHAEQARRMLVSFFSFSNIATVLALVLVGDIHRRNIRSFVILFPALIGGFFVGRAVRPRLGEAGSRAAVFTVLLTSSIAGIVQLLFSLASLR
jgi:uncharacterized protein